MYLKARRRDQIARGLLESLARKKGQILSKKEITERAYVLSHEPELRRLRVSRTELFFFIKGLIDKIPKNEAEQTPATK